MNTLKLSTALACFVIISTLTAQSNYTVYGEGGFGPDIIWKFKVVDDFNDQPLKGAKIELLNRDYRVFSIETNYDGIAVVIITDITDVRNGWILKIRDKDYSYNSWEKEILQYEYIGRRGREKILIIANDDNEVVNWTDGNNMPTYSKIANDISSGRYDIHDTRRASYHYSGPGFHEFDIRLVYKHHPRDQVRNDDARKHSNTNLINGWQEEKSRYGNVILYRKGTMGLQITKNGDNGGYLVEVWEGDEYNNRNDKDLADYEVSYQEAMRIAKDYMRKH